MELFNVWLKFNLKEGNYGYIMFGEIEICKVNLKNFFSFFGYFWLDFLFDILVV